MIYIYLIGLLLELVVTLTILWRFRYIVVALTVSLIAFSSSGLLAQDFSWVSGLIVILSIFRIFNLLRVVKGRMHVVYLKHVVRRTSLWLMAYHIVPGMFQLIDRFHLPASGFILAYSAMVVVIAFTVLLVTLRNITKTRHLPLMEHYSDKELPTVTVAIPARNETTSLEDMLRTVLANNYPKLEIVVLDESPNSKVPEIIRQFAQDGVRFVPGHEPDARWLAKNLAYEKLAEVASGELILFAGVDVRMGPEAIRALVTTMLNRNKAMISVLPRRLAGTSMDAVTQPMRYWWELALPRRRFNRPAVLCTCWLINRKTLKSLGGFAAVSRAVVPEGYFARELVKEDKYSFIRSDDMLDIQTRKTPDEQMDTAVRMRYPQFRRRPEWVLLAIMFNVAMFLAPGVLVISAFWTGFQAVHWLALVACGLFTATHIVIVQVTNPANALLAIVNLPLAAMSELLLTIVSMYQYEFSIVEWKGRDITLPVMHVVPHLPLLADKPMRKV